MFSKEHAALINNIVGNVLDNAHDADQAGDATYLLDLYDSTEEEILAALGEMNQTVTHLPDKAACPGCGRSIWPIRFGGGSKCRRCGGTAPLAEGRPA